MARTRPKIDDMDEGVQHSYDHRGDTGKFGDIYTQEVERWRKISASGHELCIFPYLCRENSIFRTKNPDFNKPFDDSKLEDGSAWSHKLTVLLHYSIGANKDTVVCPRTYKGDCPICEKRNAIFDQIDKETDKERAQTLQKQADRLGTTKRALYNVLVFDSNKEMEKGLQVWEAPHESIEDVLSDLYVDKRTGEKRYYTIPEEGWNVTFERTGTDKENTRYLNVKIVKRLDKDKFTDEELDQLYKMAYNLDEIVEIKSPAELQTMAFGLSEAEEKSESEGREEGATSRFRGDRSSSEEPKKDRESSEEREEDRELSERQYEKSSPEREKKDDIPHFPKEYDNCFGIMNGQRDECEDCPKDVWKECFQKSEKAKEPKRTSKTTSRVGERRALD